MPPDPGSAAPRRFLIFGLGILFLLAAVECTLSKTIHVPADYPTIYEAMRHTEFGDTVLVAPGTYPEGGELRIASPRVTVESEAGPLVTKIEAVCYTESVSRSVIRGFTISGWSRRYEAVFICEECRITLENCIIRVPDDSGFTWLAVEIHDAYGLRLIDCWLVDSKRGPGLWGYELSQELELRNCVIAHNDHLGYPGGGMYISSLYRMWLFGCTIAHNRARKGAAIYGAGIGNIKMSSNIIAHNEATNSLGVGGVFVNIPSGNECIVEYNDFWDNKGGDYGGSIRIGEHNMYRDPIFVDGPEGEYYLSQVAAGQSGNSACLDRADPEMAVYGTTRTDHVPDDGRGDLGYHRLRTDQTPTWTPSPTPPSPTPVPPSATATVTPTVTASPSATPVAPTITATPVPTVDVRPHLELMLNAEEYHPGSWLELDLGFEYWGDEELAELYLVLDIGNGVDYWFWPSWSHFPEAAPDYVPFFLTQGEHVWEVLGFEWPAYPESLQGLGFWAAILAPNAGPLLSNVAQVSFSYTPK